MKRLECSDATFAALKLVAEFNTLKILTPEVKFRDFQPAFAAPLTCRGFRKNSAVTK